MHEKVVDFFKEWSDEISSGNSDKLFERFLLPLTIFAADQVIVVRHRQDFERMFDAFGRELTASGLSGNRMRLNSVVKESASGVSVWATSSYVNRSGLTERHTDLKFFFRVVGGDLKIEMVEVGDMSGANENPFLRVAFAARPARVS